MRRRAAVIALAAVLFAAACGGSENPVPAAVDGVVEPTVEPREVVSAASPLEAKLGFSSDPARRQQQLVELQRQADDELVQCMTGAGFFYAVGPLDEALRSGAYAGDGTRAWVEANGLGITSAYRDVVETPPGSAERSSDAAALNLEYVASLSAEEALAYDVALVGSAPPEATGASAQYQPAGCWGGAFAPILTRIGYIDEFKGDLDSLNSRFASDPRVAAFTRSWSACMNAAGHRYPDQAAMNDDMYARLLELEIVEVDGATAFVVPERIEDLLAIERAVALVSFDCSRSFDTEFTQLRHDYESEFLDDNRFRIAELVES